MHPEADTPKSLKAPTPCRHVPCAFASCGSQPHTRPTPNPLMSPRALSERHASLGWPGRSRAGGSMNFGTRSRAFGYGHHDVAPKGITPGGEQRTRHANSELTRASGRTRALGRWQAGLPPCPPGAHAVFRCVLLILHDTRERSPVCLLPRGSLWPSS